MQNPIVSSPHETSDESQELCAFRKLFDIEMEQLILGQLLGNVEAMNHISPDLRPHHFFDPTHQAIFDLIRTGYTNGKAVTPVTIKQHFAEKSWVVQDSYLARLAASYTGINNLRDISANVITFAHKRQLQATLIETARRCGNFEQSLGDITSAVSAAMDQIRRESTSKAMLTSKQVGLKVIESIRNPVPTISTGLTRLDAAIGGGLRRGQAYALAGRYGHGKTMFASTISGNLEQTGHKHMFIAAEMDDEEIYARTLARRLNVTYDQFYKPQDLYPEGFISELGYLVTTDKENVIYTADPFLTLDRLKQYVATAVAKHNIEGFILDYWQLVGGAQRGHKTDHLDEVAQWVASACKEYKIWCIMLSQLNRDGDTRGGDGILNAFPFAFYIERVDNSAPFLWLRCQKARHVKVMNVGKPMEPAYRIMDEGPYIEEIPYGVIPDDFTPPEQEEVSFTPRKRKSAKKVPKDITVSQTESEPDLLAATE